MGSTLKFTIAATQAHERGKTYRVRADGKTVSILFTFHSLGRMRRWGSQIGASYKRYFRLKKFFEVTGIALLPIGGREDMW